MEKIYMEDKGRQQKKSVVDFSVVLSFAVAIFAIFSIATYGVVSNQGMDAVSYAAPIGTTAEQFTFTTAKNNGADLLITTYSGTTAGFNVPVYLANNNSNNPVFCVEHATDVFDNVTYYNEGPNSIDDYGLLYLLYNSFANDVRQIKNDDIATGAEIKDYAETWVTQVAIWVYLNEAKGGARNAISEADLNSIKGATSLKVGDATFALKNNANIYNKYVQPLVNSAKSAPSRRVLAVTKANGEVSKTSDEKFYQSPLITVSANLGTLKNYSVTLTGVDGAFIVNEEGEKINSNNIAPGVSFFVRIPVENVKSEVTNLTVSVAGVFDALTGSYYVAKENGNPIVSGADDNYPGVPLQKVVSVTGTTRTENEGVTIELVAAPDTGMNTAQTIYFIGLIILLCGVGIVYANAKPVEAKQQ